MIADLLLRIGWERRLYFFPFFHSKIHCNEIPLLLSWEKTVLYFVFDAGLFSTGHVESCPRADRQAVAGRR